MSDIGTVQLRFSISFVPSLIPKTIYSISFVTPLNDMRAFLSVLPEDLIGTKISGVEVDSITWRLAR